jgi:hypothetical protein
VFPGLVFFIIRVYPPFVSKFWLRHMSDCSVYTRLSSSSHHEVAHQKSSPSKRENLRTKMETNERSVLHSSLCSALLWISRKIFFLL